MFLRLTTAATCSGHSCWRRLPLLLTSAASSLTPPPSLCQFSSAAAAAEKLQTVFDTKSLPTQELKVWQKNHGLFLYEELCEPDGFLRMRDQAVADSERLVSEACSCDRRRKMVLVFDELSDCLCRVADMAEFVRLAHPSAAFRHRATEACVSINNLVETMNTCVPLYKSLEQVVTNGDTAAVTDSVDQWVSRLYLRDFQQAGIQLADSDRQQVVQLMDTALQAGQAFLTGSQEPSRVDPALVPTQLKPYLSRDGGQCLVGESFVASEQEQVRRLMYELFHRTESGQLAALHTMLSCRHRLARLCGFSSFAERTLVGSLVGEPALVTEFLHQISELAHSDVQREFDKMAAIKQSFSSEPLAVWDVNYVSRLADQLERPAAAAAAGGDSGSGTNVSECFSVGTCMRGLSELFSRLFGVTLVAEDTLHGEVWSSDVRKLAVVHETDGLLGHIYCDLFSRPGKPRQDCHFTIRGGRRCADGSYQDPVVVLMLSLPAAGWSRPSLLSHGQLQVLFHEMGHAMHSMLGRTRYQHVTGTRCSTDFAEVPAVLLERFADDWRVLGAFARHYRTGARPDADSVRRFCRSRACHFPLADMQLQVMYAAVDQSVHGAALSDSLADPEHQQLHALVSSVQRRHYPLRHAPHTAWYLRFGHLVGYGARYYSYLVARAVAGDIWRHMFAADPFSRTMGDKYHRDCLAHGGGVPAPDIVSRLLARPVTSQWLARALLDDINSQR